MIVRVPLGYSQQRPRFVASLEMTTDLTSGTKMNLPMRS